MQLNQITRQQKRIRSSMTSSEWKESQKQHQSIRKIVSNEKKREKKNKFKNLELMSQLDDVF